MFRILLLYLLYNIIMNSKKKYYDNDEINRNVYYFNYDNDITKDMRIGDNTKISNDIKQNNKDIIQNNNVLNTLDNYFLINNNLSNLNNDNTKRKNLNYSNYLNPMNMSNTGIGNVNIYNSLLYPEQTRKIDNTREKNYNNYNYDNNLLYNNYNVNDEYFRNGYDSRIINKKMIN